MLSAPRLVAPRLVAARPALARRGRPLVSRAPRRSPGRSAGAYGERRGASGGWANEFGDEYESIDADDGWFEPPRGPPRRGRPPRGDRGAPSRGGRFDDRANRGGGRRRDFDDRGRRGGPPAARGDDWVEESFPCSGKAPGRIIGKGGATIARIQDATGARIDVLRDERVCVVSGPPAAVAAAVAQAKLVASEGDGPPGPWSDRDGARSVRRGDEGGDFAERVVPCSGLGPGRVIGKGGATVKRLQEDFGVRVDVRTEDGQCFVSGAGAENVDACAAEVARIIEEGDGYVPVGYEEGGFGDGDVRSRSRAPRFAGFDPTRARSMGSSSSQTLETLAFRTELEIGRIIGRGGATVRAIEEDTGARVQVDKRTLECVVSGSEAAVGAASRTIRRVAEEGFGGAVRRIPCGGSEGLIIGPGGARVRALAARTKARIDVEKVSEFHSECVIRGNPDAVAQAADAVERALAEEGGGGFDERGGRYVAYERGGGDRHAYDDRERPRRGYDAYPRDAAEEYRRPRDDAYSRDEAYASRDDAARRRRRFPEDRGGRGGGGRGGGGRPRWSDRGGGDRGDRYADGWD